jgi:hypothetical protein
MTPHYVALSGVDSILCGIAQTYDSSLCRKAWSRDSLLCRIVRLSAMPYSALRYTT